MFKSITELCDLDSSKQKLIYSNVNNQSTIQYHVFDDKLKGFVKSDLTSRHHPQTKHIKIARSHNISPSVGYYNVSYKCLDSHPYEVQFSSPRREKKIMEESPNTVRRTPPIKHVPKLKGGTDFEKQISREQMYLTRGWLKFDKSMRTPKKTLEEKLRLLELGQEAMLKFPQIDVKENPSLMMKVSHLPLDYDKMKQMSKQYLEKYNIKQSTLRFYSP